MKTNLLCILLVLSLMPRAWAEVIQVTPDQPNGLSIALDRASTDPAITEIVLAGGEYKGWFGLGAPKGVDPAKLPTLTIRAAEGQVPLLRYSVRIDKAQPVAGKAGLFKSATIPPTGAQMWERDTRVRYLTLSNKDSVAAHPGSCFVDEVEKTLYFSTSDGKAPAEHEVRLCLMTTHSRGLGINRSHVVVEGLHFADYICDDNTAIQSYGEDHTIRRCHFENCDKAWTPWTDSTRMVMEDCTGQDVGQPMISYSKGVTVRNCRFEKTRDRFLFELYPQNDCGYQVYSPGGGGTFEGNFAKGYFNGILIKAEAGPYVIRHNTIIDAHSGILWAATREHSDVSYNVVVGARAFVHARSFMPDFNVDHNLFWDPRELGEFDSGTKTFRGANMGKFNLLADPRFADASHGDYRLLPDSPALWLKDKDGKPAGAFGVATIEDAKNAAPTLSLAFQADSTAFGATGDYTFDRDPWIGGGTTHIRELAQEGVPKRLTGNKTIVVEPRAFDTTGSIVKMKFTVGDAAPQEIAYDDVYKLALPEAEGEYRVRCQVQNDRGTWSAPAEAIVRVDRQAPVLDGKPQIIANDQGVIVAFKASEPCFATLRFGRSAEELSGRVETPPLINRFWDSNDGGEWVETWRIPRAEQALAVLAPAVEKGQTVYCRLTLIDQGGLSSESEVFTATVKGEPRTINVSPGKDALQHAVDRALPGDRIVLEPGVYTASRMLNHGGTDENHRITIEAGASRLSGMPQVTFDGAKKYTAMLHLENAPWVTLRGLRVLYYRKAGIYSYRSPHTTIDQCVFYNGPGWVTGYHTFMFNSPGGVVTRCLARGSEVAFYFLASPGATVTHNTSSQHMYASTAYCFSARGSTQMYNSFAFAGNDIYSFEVAHPDELKTFRSDYNNMGTDVSGYGDNAHYAKDDPAMWQQLQAEKFPANYPVGFQTVSKALAYVSGKRYLTLKSWREATGQDMHSVFADPQYVNPMPPIDRWDWRVKPGSPNITPNESDKTIGAFPGIPGVGAAN